MNTKQDSPIQSWYPVSRSCDLKKSQTKAVKLFGKDWLLFRTESGAVSCLARYCCHMGADLCQGKVRQENIECSLHAWQFSTAGNCVHIPDYTKPLPERHIQHLLSEEKYGLIFVFWGQQALFPLPVPPDSSPQLVYSQARKRDINTDYQVLSLNSFDTQHFKHVHNRVFVKRPDIYPINRYALRIDFTAQILQNHWVDYVMSYLQKGNIRASIECWGASIMTLSNPDLYSSALVAMQPTDKGQCTCYLVAMKAYQEKASLADKLSVAIAATLFQSFLNADIKPTMNMQLHRGGLLEDIDYGAIAYWDYLAQLPRFNVGR